MNQKQTQYDKLIERIKNNPVTVTLLIVGTIVIGIGSFIGAINKIAHLRIKTDKVEELQININGKWVSEIKPHYYVGIKNYYRYILEMTQIGDSFTGIILKKFDDIPRVEEKSILGGTITGNVIKFYTKGEYYKTTSGTTGIGFKKAEYTVKYNGQMVGDEILFVGQDDRGYSPVHFTLSKEK